MSGPAGGVGAGATAGRWYPFTASQCQELEHQALIFKCLASGGKPIPSYLTPPLRRILIDSALACTSPFMPMPLADMKEVEVGYSHSSTAGFLTFRHIGRLLKNPSCSCKRCGVLL